MTKTCSYRQCSTCLGELEMGNFTRDGNEMETFGCCLEVTK